MISGPRLFGITILSVYVGALLLSPAVRIGGIQGMRGITLDHIFIFMFMGFVWIFARQGAGSALHISFRDRTSPGYWYIWIVLIATVAGVFRIVFDQGMFWPMIEVARLYGLARPFFIILFAAVIYRIYCLSASAKYCADLDRVVIIFGSFAVSIGVLQGIGIPWAVDFTNTYYTRDLNFEDVLVYGRAYGTFDGQPNVYGTFCGLLFLLTLFKLKRVGSGLILTPLLILTALGLLLSGSRGALLALIISTTAWALFRRSLRALLAICFICVAVFFVMSLSSDLVSISLLNRLGSALGLGGGGDVNLIGTRVPYWTKVGDLVLENPWRLFWGIPGKIMPPADNLQLGLIGGLGVFGASLYMILILRYGILHFSEESSASLNIFIVLIFLLLNGISYPTFLNARIGDLFWLAATLASIHLYDNRRRSCESYK